MRPVFARYRVRARRARGARGRGARLQGADRTHVGSRGGDRVPRLPGRDGARSDAGDGRGRGARPERPRPPPRARRGRTPARRPQAGVGVRRRERCPSSFSRPSGARRRALAREQVWITRAARGSALPDVTAIANGRQHDRREMSSPARTRTSCGRSRPSLRSRSVSAATRSPGPASSSGRPPRRSRRTGAMRPGSASSGRGSSRRGASRTPRRMPSRGNVGWRSACEARRSRSGSGCTRRWRHSWPQPIWSRRETPTA